ncbi:MAG TPA: CAP domain-containing protein [Conexibacter sp.]|nr:CAP domain-containing protein [Conexibacter sp.]
MRAFALGLACALATLLAVAPVGARADAFSGALLRQLNRVRAAHHLPAVREDGGMDRAAAGHSRDMARRGYFAHGSWPGRVMAAARSARSVGEVIGWQVRLGPGAEAAGMVRMWLGSPPHRHVLLHGGFNRVGIGRAGASRGGRPIALYTVDRAG